MGAQNPESFDYPFTPDSFEVSRVLTRRGGLSTVHSFRVHCDL